MEVEAAITKIESWITVYVRGPETDWFKINVDQFGPFDHTVLTVRNIMLENELVKENTWKYFTLNLVGGGLVERN